MDCFKAETGHKSQQSHPPSEPESDETDLSDRVFEKASERHRQTRQEKRLTKQRHALHWGEATPLDGGIDQLKEAQKVDPTLVSARRTAGLAQSPFYWNNEGLLCRQGPVTSEPTRVEQVLPEQY